MKSKRKLIAESSEDRYSHLAGLSEEEIKIVMCLADFVTDRIGEAKEKGEQVQNFYMVYLQGGNPLRKIHLDKKVAAAEAEELTATTGRKSFIMQAISACVPTMGKPLWDGKEEELIEGE